MSAHGPAAPGAMAAYLFDVDHAAVDVDRYVVEDREYVALRVSTAAGSVFLCARDRLALRRLLVDAVREAAR